MVSAAPMHTLEIVPGVSVSSFVLGQTLFSLLNLIRSDRLTYPTVKVAFDEASPSTSSVHLNLSTPPLRLLFDGPTQRLCRIEVHDQPGRWATYRGQALASLSRSGSDDPQEAVKVIRRVMGPTYSSATGGGGGGPTEGGEVLSYPGVAFELGEAGQGAATELSRIIVTALPPPAGVSIDQAWLHPVLPDSPAIAQGDLREVEIKLDETRKPAAITLHFHSAPDATPLAPIYLQLGVTTNEDLLCDLGSPIRSFWKEDDRMSIHSTPSAVDPALQPNGYFQSYPHLGLTFLLHPTRHTLAKLILHSNLPGETNFGRSTRASWAIRHPSTGQSCTGTDKFAAVARLLRGGAAPAAGPGNGPGLAPPPAGGNESDSGGSRAASVDSARTGTSSSGGKRSRKGPGSGSGSGSGSGGRGTPVLVLGAGGSAAGAGEEAEWERPMLLDRAADGEDGRDKQTELHGYPGLVFEVTSADEVETVWLF